MKRFTSPGRAQRFLSAFSGISPHFRPGRDRLTAPEWRTEMTRRFAVWQGGHRERGSVLKREQSQLGPSSFSPNRLHHYFFESPRQCIVGRRNQHRFTLLVHCAAPLHAFAVPAMWVLNGRNGV